MSTTAGTNVAKYKISNVVEIAAPVPLYLVTFTDGSSGIYTWEVVGDIIMDDPYSIVSIEELTPTLPTTPEWVMLTQVSIVVAVPAEAPPLPEWVQLAQANIAVGISVPTPPTPEWVMLVEVSIVVAVPAPPPAPEWVMLAQVSISVKVPGVPEVPPKVPPEVPPEKVEFPWVPVALIGGGVVLAAVSLKPKTRKS